MFVAEGKGKIKLKSHPAPGLISGGIFSFN